MEISRNFFESKIKPILTYIGTIGAALSSIAYIAMIWVLILGFENHTDLTNTLLFAIINGAFGLVIMQFLKYQGETFGKQLPENAEVLKEYYATKTKDKVYHSMKYYWITSVIKDVLFKGISIIVSSCCIIYIVIVGSENYTLLLLAVVNLILFFSFGLLALAKTYDYVNNIYINFVREQLRLREEEKEREAALCEILEDSTVNMQLPVVAEYGVINQTDSLNHTFIMDTAQLCSSQENTTVYTD